MTRSRATIWHPCSQMQHHESLPIVPIARGDGAWLIDFDGQRYLDAVSSWWTNLFGHNHPRLKAAILKQLDTLDHVMLAGFTHRPAVDLAEALVSVTPRGLGHVMFASDGASATEIALKMSAHFWLQSGKPNKTQFVSLSGSYHGETIGALSVTDVPLFKSAYAALVRNTLTVDNPANVGTTYALAALSKLLDERGDSVAAMIVEPLVQGANAMSMYDTDYLRGAHALCKAHNVHFIADEIMTGFGRTGTLFACEQADITPDFLCLSKGITGGTLPLSCVLTTDAVYAAFYHPDMTRGFLHSHSYTGNPLACAAACEVLAIFREEDVIARNRGRTEVLSAPARALASHANVEHYRQCGMIWAFDIASNRENFSRWAFAEAMQRGVLLRPIGKTVYWMPPYCLEERDIAQLADTTRAILDNA